MQEGVVIKSTGSWYNVRLEDERILQCRIIGKFRMDGKKLTNPVAVGDKVGVELDQEEGKGIIKAIRDRENYVVRQSPRKKHDLHLLASNIDQAVVIITIVQPNLKQGFIDRFLLMTEPYNIPTTIVFNKSDVYSDDDLLVYKALDDIYAAIGYKTLLVSAQEKYRIGTLRELLKDKVTLISGQSGVGKSSIVNAIQP
ncbi:MAG: ribosome small subunit-dependent GTPase A, partial [Bacteroidota bacterium]